MKVLRVTKDEFELSDGTILPMMVDFDKVPTVEEMQVILDENLEKFGLGVEDGSKGKGEGSV